MGSTQSTWEFELEILTLSTKMDHTSTMRPRRRTNVRVGFDDYRNSICQMSDSDEEVNSFHTKKRLIKNPLAELLNQEISCFNPTTLKTVFRDEEEGINSLPTQKVINDEKEFYILYQMKDWRKIKAKTRQLRLNETESDYALRQQMMRFGGLPESDSDESGSQSESNSGKTLLSGITESEIESPPESPTEWY